MSRFSFKNRHALARAINITLVVITVTIMLAGLQAYNRLNTMVDELKSSAEPNYNLLILKEVAFYVNEMERDIDIYRNDPQSTYLMSFNAALDESQYLLDSLKTQIKDEEILERCDSLSYNIKEWAKVQTKIGALNSDLLGSTLEELTQKIEEIPQELAKLDTLEEKPKKRGLLKRIFTRKPKKDSISKPSQSEILQSEILTELAKTKEEVELKGSKLRYQLSNLEVEAEQYQEQIINIINELETYEFGNDLANVKGIQSLASETNQEVVTFSVLTSLLLLITLVSQLNYVGRNRKHQNVLNLARRNAQELAKTKEKFLANMSHEIRTPMNAISGFTDQLLKTDLSDKQKDQLQIVKSSSDHLLHLLNDILDLSKLQANKVVLEKSSFDIKRLVLECVKIFEDKAAEKKLKFTTEFEAVPRYVIGDPYRLKQITLNLIHNAIKYTNSGFVKVSLSVPQKNQKDIRIQLSVKDSGIGIPLEKQARIFKEFEQAQTSHQSKGTGLGLAICNMLVKLHNGEINIESDAGKGTEMIVTLPYEIGQASDKKDKNTLFKPVSLSDISILVADDEPFNLKLLETIFSNHEVNLVQAKDGIEALELLNSEPFDIALLDVKMPGKSGFEVVQQIRQNVGVNSKTPMIALTATVSDQEKVESLSLGFNHILRKPFEEQELLELVNSETTDTKKQSAIKKPIESEKAKYDLSTLQKMGDEAFVLEMIDIFKSSYSKSIRNLKKASKLQIRDSIKNEAHKMLPTARHLNAMTLVTAIEALQKKADKESFEKINDRISEIEAIYTDIKNELSERQ